MNDFDDAAYEAELAEKSRLLAAADPSLNATLIQVLRAAIIKHDFSDNDLYWLCMGAEPEPARLVAAELAIALKILKDNSQ